MPDFTECINLKIRYGISEKHHLVNLRPFTIAPLGNHRRAGLPFQTVSILPAHKPRPLITSSIPPSLSRELRLGFPEVSSHSMALKKLRMKPL